MKIKECYVSHNGISCITNINSLVSIKDIEFKSIKNNINNVFFFIVLRCTEFIITDYNYGNAKIIETKTCQNLEKLKDMEFDLLIVPGFISKNDKELTYNSKLVFPDISNLDVTTGASNDLKQANSIARNYVNLFGMGKGVGVFDSSDSSQPFLGRDLAMNSNKLSEYSKQEIDIEITRLVNYAHEMAINILMKNSDILRTVTNDLIKDRTITGKELDKYTIRYN